MSDSDVKSDNRFKEEEASTESFEEKVERVARWLDYTGKADWAAEIRREAIERKVLEAQHLITMMSLEEHIRETQTEFLMTKSVELSSMIFDKATTYNNAMITLGYAGFFAIWNFVNDSIPELDRLCAGVLLGISLLIFIAWVLFSGVSITLYTRRMSVEIIKSYETIEEKLSGLMEAEARERARAGKTYVIWPYVFIASSFTGVAAGILLLNAMLVGVTEWGYYLEDLVNGAK